MVVQEAGVHLPGDRFEAVNPFEAVSKVGFEGNAQIFMLLGAIELANFDKYYGEGEPGDIGWVSASDKENDHVCDHVCGWTKAIGAISVPIVNSCKLSMRAFQHDGYQRHASRQIIFFGPPPSLPFTSPLRTGPPVARQLPKRARHE